MFNNTLFAYGLGWFVGSYRGYTLIHHGGHIDGFSLLYGFVPQKRIAVVVLVNADGNPCSDVLFYEAIDRALDLPDNDWNAKFHTLHDAVDSAADAGDETSVAERLPDASPSHPLGATMVSSEGTCAAYYNYGRFNS